jgi:hypothetical protein
MGPRLCRPVALERAGMHACAIDPDTQVTEFVDQQ